MFLCDTNVISEILRPRPDPKLLDWAEGVPTILLSSITVEEIFYGLSWKPKPRIMAAVELLIAERCELLMVSPEIARRSGKMRGNLQARGRTRALSDMLLAATAQVHQLTLVTRNVKDFEGCEISLLNPFE